MTQLTNLSPFAAELLRTPDKEGQENALVVLSASFTESPDKRLTPTMPQPPIVFADEHYADPTASSVRYPGDAFLFKPFVDIIVNGHAYAPSGRATLWVVVELHAADVHKRLRVSGNRCRRWYWLFRPSPMPEAFLKMPVVYERAFGGTDRRSANPKRHKVHRWNPVGTGFKAQRCVTSGAPTDAPNISKVAPRYGFAEKSPAGFGAIGRSWYPRIKFAGTYDDNWLKNQWPLLPADFDPRFEQAAPLDQQSRQIQGGEEVRLVNMTPEGEWRFRLPKLRVPLRLIFGNRHETATLRLDTVIIEPDMRRVKLSARCAFRVIRNQQPLNEVVLGHVSRGWLRAKVRKKVYRDPLGTAGSMPGVHCYE